MRALFYLQITRLKNRIKELRRRPAKLILFLVFAGLLVFVLITAMGNEAGAVPQDDGALFAIMLAFFAFTYVIGLFPGLGSGTTFYTMADVSLLFTAPLSPKRILYYGLIKQLGTTALTGMFLLFQYGWLRSSFGISFGQMLVIVSGYGLIVFAAQLTAMWIYCVSSGSDGRKRVIRTLIWAVCGATLLWLLRPVFAGGGVLESLFTRGAEPMGMAFPMAGWVVAIIRGLFTGDAILLLIGVGAMGAFLLIVTLVILRLNADYYEDVLLATEVTHSAVAAAKEGRMTETGRRTIKVGKTGIGRGRGASVFFFKHLIESRRAGRFLLSTMSLLLMAIPIGLAVFLGRAPESFLPALIASCFLTLFSFSASRWGMEMLKPYIYLVPQNPFKKLIMLCGESVLKCVLESAVLMVALGLITGVSWTMVGVGILIRVGVGLLVIAMSAAMERLFGQIKSPMIVLPLFLFFAVLFIGPGVGMAMLAVLWLGMPLTVALWTVVLWCYGVSFLVIFLCRNMLTWAEFQY
ncbi:MAG: putative ABC exporter domain-containing protein [Oscillospiraceae bacterium]|nr:putative ABC exporter domain-containing protein [Oscillospiraceae bacterium]